MAGTTDVLPDVLAPGLSIVFCGTAAGAESARRRAYYAGPGNAFWPTLARVGLLPRRFAPEEFAGVVAFGIGLTDLAKRVAGSDRSLSREQFDAPGLRAKIVANRPCWLAFTSKRAAQEYFGAPAAYGVASHAIGDTRVWVLPSPSGAARGSWDEGPWRALAAVVTARPDR